MKLLFFTSFSLFLSFNLEALDPKSFKWEILEEKRGITIYRAPRHKETGIIPIKGQSTLDHSMPKILSVLSDTSKKKLWVPKLKKTFIIEQKSKYARIEYALYNSPWPLQDRSFVISTDGRFNPVDKSVYIDIRSTTHPKFPLTDKDVRGKTYIGSVYLKAISEKKTYFEIVLLTDFSGSIPTWIINIVQKKWPYKMFSNIDRYMRNNEIEIMPKFKSFHP